MGCRCWVDWGPWNPHWVVQVEPVEPEVVSAGQRPEVVPVEFAEIAEFAEQTAGQER